MIRKHKTEIVISLLTGIFLFYIQSILSFVGELFIDGVLLASDSFSSMYYKMVAKNDPNGFGEWTNFLQIYFLMFMLLYFIYLIKDKRTENKRRIDDNLKKIEISKERLVNKSTIKTKDEDIRDKTQLAHDLGVLEAEINLLKLRLEKRDVKLINLYILCFFLLVFLFSTYVITKSVSNENTDFRNELIKLEPYASDQEIKKLRANWAEMNNKADYKKVIEQLRILQNKTDKR